MEWLLSFFSGLIIFTVGILVLLAWLAAIVLISVEVYDNVTDRFKTNEDEEENY